MRLHVLWISKPGLEHSPEFYSNRSEFRQNSSAGHAVRDAHDLPASSEKMLKPQAFLQPQAEQAGIVADWKFQNSGHLKFCQLSSTMSTKLSAIPGMIVDI